MVPGQHGYNPLRLEKSFAVQATGGFDRKARAMVSYSFFKQVLGDLAPRAALGAGEQPLGVRLG